MGWHKSTLRVGSPPFKVGNKIVDSKAEKAATLLTSIIDRYPPKADLQFDPMEGYAAEEEKYA